MHAGEVVLASGSGFTNGSVVRLTAPDGTVHVSDNGQARILAIRLVETPFNVYHEMALCIVAFFFLFDRFRCLSGKWGVQSSASLTATIFSQHLPDSMSGK